MSIRWGMTPPAYWPVRAWPYGVMTPSVGLWTLSQSVLYPSFGTSIIEPTIGATVLRASIEAT